MLLLRDLPSQGGWVHSGSAIGWAKPLEPLYDLIVYLHLDPALRLARLKRREHARYGSRIAPDGDMTHTHAAFMKWAASYDTAGVEQRSRAAHEAWLARQTAPVLRLDAAQPIGDLASTVVSALSRQRQLLTPFVDRLVDQPHDRSRIARKAFAYPA